MAQDTASVAGIELYGLEVHGELYQDESTGQVFVSLPERLKFSDRMDTYEYVCRGGERLVSIAAAVYKDAAPAGYTPADCWEILAQFQPTPILRPAAMLGTGQIIYCPSVDCINEFLGDSLRELDPALIP